MFFFVKNITKPHKKIKIIIMLHWVGTFSKDTPLYLKGTFWKGMAPVTSFVPLFLRMFQMNPRLFSQIRKEMAIKNIPRMTELWMKTKCSNADIRMCSRFTVEYMFTWSQEDPLRPQLGTRLDHSRPRSRPISKHQCSDSDCPFTMN